MGGDIGDADSEDDGDFDADGKEQDDLEIDDASDGEGASAAKKPRVD